MFNNNSSSIIDKLLFMKSINGSGNSGNADWNANEGEAGYIKNRPFYQEHDIVRTQVLNETGLDVTNTNCFRYAIHLTVSPEIAALLESYFYGGEITINNINLTVDNIEYYLPSYITRADIYYGAPPLDDFSDSNFDWSEYPISFEFGEIVNDSIFYFQIYTKEPIHSCESIIIGEAVIEEEIDVSSYGVGYYSPIASQLGSVMRAKYGNSWDAYPDTLTLVTEDSEVILHKDYPDRSWYYGEIETDDLSNAGFWVNVGGGSTGSITIPYLYQYPGLFSIKDGDDLLIENAPYAYPYTLQYDTSYRIYGNPTDPIISLVPIETTNWPDNLTVVIDGKTYTIPRMSSEDSVAYGLYIEYEDYPGVVYYSKNVPVEISFQQLDGENIINIISPLNLNAQQIEIYFETDEGEVHKIDPIFLPSALETVTLTSVWDTETENFTWTCGNTFAELLDVFSSFDSDIAIGSLTKINADESSYRRRDLLAVTKYLDEGEGNNYIELQTLGGTTLRLYEDNHIEQ